MICFTVNKADGDIMGKKIILLIEDDMPTIDIYRIALEMENFEVDVADFGKKALEKIGKINKGEKKKPNAIILDLILPDMNGLDILEEIKKDDKVKDIPVFVLTNYIDSEIEKRAYGLNPEKFMLKTDYTPREIAEMVKKKLETK
ncbi:MAG: response regulator [Candidatus Pacebacteria bacterium]|jgi:DNA-binding response OmpR family regulator|nr:response regulator [Candidatus Paceibacterota bacterium]MDD3072490.1 response regulator [Candidatus Paceibacterota bacterium]MDD3729210.1 response regulator [Candidatus Paceibacterota bacterium]MDD4201742.1 response regulator [Candidatus Paceibacterota bacterium]MDD4466897.1 response regulator [Candidatus Paceibacterota bacterium]